MFLPSIRGRGRPLLALLFLLIPALGQAATNEADVQLQTDISTMFVQVDQGAPLPPGGCVSGHTWHTTYGGCRRAESQPETAECPASYTGIRTRYRTAYILQANAYDVVYEGWGAWQDNCTASRGAGVVDAVIAKVAGDETGEQFVNTLSGNIAAQMQVNYGTLFGATIYRPTAELSCIFASGTTLADTNRVWMGQLLPPGSSVNKGSPGSCQLSNGNRTATLVGNCDSNTGGDSSSCVAATRVINITSVSGCAVATETRQGSKLVDVGSFNICD